MICDDEGGDVCMTGKPDRVENGVVGAQLSTLMLCIVRGLKAGRTQKAIPESTCEVVEGVECRMWTLRGEIREVQSHVH